MKRLNVGKDRISPKSPKPSELTTKPKASKAPKAQTECMSVWRHAGRRSASKIQGQPNIQSHTFDWDSQANLTSLAPAVARSNAAQEDAPDSGTESIHSNYFALRPDYGQRGSSFHRMERDARSPRGVSRGPRSKVYFPVMLDGTVRDARSPLPYVTPPLQRPRRITLHGSSLPSPVNDRQNHELPNNSDPWVPRARPSLKRRRRTTLHAALPSSSDDFSRRSRSFHDTPNDSNYSNMSTLPSLFTASVPSVLTFSPGSVYSTSETSLQSPRTIPFLSTPQASLVDAYGTASSSLRSYSSQDPSPITEMGQYCGSFASPNLGNPWGIPSGSLDALSSPPNPFLPPRPSGVVTGHLLHDSRHDTDFDHNPRNPYFAGVNQLNNDISPQGVPPFSSSSSYTSKNYESYQPLLAYNPIFPTAASDLYSSPGVQNALQLEFGPSTLDLPKNIDVSESDTGPLDPELLLLDFYIPQNDECSSLSD